MDKPPLTILLAAPRGFCAGVDRAIQIVELALARYGAPVYVRHEIVHNRFVVEGLERRGAIFVDELADVPEGAHVIFSAHGVPKSVPADAARRNLQWIDATCPLVSKVHREAERHHAVGRHVVLIGHAGHPEVVGTMGQLPPGAISLVETEADVRRLAPADPENLAYTTQTTLSVDDTRAVIEALRARFPKIEGPRHDDICYATQNRQDAVRELATQCDLVLVVGSVNSSNSNRLRELAEKQGASAYLIDGAEHIDPAWLVGRRAVGVTAGASAPEVLVQGVIARVRELGGGEVREMRGEVETMTFALPKELRIPVLLV
jgi:4-hydroxy-3-methylbut-2-en-1-yl diphosphate reductase